MRKTLLLTPILCFLLFSAKAQLTNTKWKGTITVPEPKEITWVFQQDTLKVIFTDSSVETEVMIYKADVKTLRLTKVSGGSSCDPTISGTYSYMIADDKLTIKMIQDACPERADAVSDKTFGKVK